MTVDLRELPWGADPDQVRERLRQAPGVLDVRVDECLGQALVLHDSRTSFPALWNWLRAQGDDPSRAGD
ncbi:MAG TPA: hypothetical protein VD813_09495 [Pseudonocardia sp.]|nr:hypothetical protein [Pseudonocardia sp.]